MNPHTDAEHEKPVRANKLELIERLADDLAHEIKNPLHSMVINLEVLKRRVARASTEAPEDLMRYIGVLAGELERVNRRVDFLLHIARPNRGGEAAGLGEVLEEHVEMLELVCERRGIEFRYQPGPYGGYASIPHDAMRQAVLAVLLHVIDLSSTGAVVEVVAEQDAAESRLIVRSGAEAASLASEQGRGLAAARALLEKAGGQLNPQDPPADPTGAGNFRSSLVLSIPLGRR